jgi:hypothetical protein
MRDFERTDSELVERLSRADSILTERRGDQLRRAGH